MKRFVFFVALVALTAASVAGCSPKEVPQLDRQSLKLYVGEQARLTADRSVAWGSADDFYATVDEQGTVTAQHVGTTTVVAATGSGQAVCTVEIMPRYNTFVEPLYELFGQPMEAIATLETGEIIQTEQLHDRLKMVSIKEDNPKLKSRSYFCFLYGEVFRVKIMRLEAYKKDIEEIIGFCEERYEVAQGDAYPFSYKYPGNYSFPHTCGITVCESTNSQDIVEILYEAAFPVNNL